jgi:hypothetical protein
MKISLLKTIVTLFIFSSILRADDDPLIMSWGIDGDYGFALEVTGGTPYSGQTLNPPVGTMMVPSWGASYVPVIFDALNMNIWAANGTPLGSITAKTEYVTNGDNNGQNYPYSSGTFNTGTSPYLRGATLKFAYNASKSITDTGSPWSENWWYDLSISPASFNLGPAAIPNANWSNGLGNSESIPVTAMNFWAIDYGMDFTPNTGVADDYRWYASEGAIWQSTKLINQNGGYGSRAYATQLVQDSTTGDWSGVSGGTGVAYDGCWQIDIKIGSPGTLNSLVGGTGAFCETFYLAERINLYPGTANYLDGSSAGGSGNNSQYGREIDIMETSWNGAGATASTPTGPQVNLPDGADTGWLASPVNGQTGVNQKAADWSDVGGAPTSDFVTFGILIKGNQIWFYAYKPDGTQWYSYGPIDKTNTTYNQVGPFVPYIGTWNNNDPSAAAQAGFVTGYKNFVYTANTDSMIKGFNPKKHPKKFGRALLRRAQTVAVKALPYPHGVPANRLRVGGTYSLSAKASSGLNIFKYTTSDSSAAVIVKGRDGATLLRILRKKPFKVIATQSGNSKWQSASGVLHVSPN